MFHVADLLWERLASAIIRELGSRLPGRLVNDLKVVRKVVLKSTSKSSARSSWSRHGRRLSGRLKVHLTVACQVVHESTTSRLTNHLQSALAWRLEFRLNCTNSFGVRPHEPVFKVLQKHQPASSPQRRRKHLPEVQRSIRWKAAATYHVYCHYIHHFQTHLSPANTQT